MLQIFDSTYRRNPNVVIPSFFVMLARRRKFREQPPHFLLEEEGTTTRIRWEVGQAFDVNDASVNGMHALEEEWDEEVCREAFVAIAPCCSGYYQCTLRIFPC